MIHYDESCNIHTCIHTCIHTYMYIENVESVENVLFEVMIIVVEIS